MKFTKLLILAALLSSCTDEPTATRVLQQAGYKNIEMTGWRPFMGGQEDAYSTGFKATAPNGSIVTGAVTGGPFKGNTIRLD